MKKDYSDIIDECVTLYNNGESIRSIASRFNVHKNTMSKLIKSKTELRNRSITKADKDLFYDLYCKGYSVREIVEVTKRGYPSVARALREHGIGNYGENRKYEYLKDDFIKDYESGLSLTEIGNKYGINRATIYEYLKDESVQLRENSIASREHYVDDDYFDELDPHKYYILGRIFATGNVYEVQESYFLNIIVDKDNYNNTLDTIKDFTNKNINNFQTNKKDKSQKIRINSKKIYHRLKELKIGECVPKEINNIDFWKGFFDLSLTVNNRSLYISSYKYKNDILNFFKNHGISEELIRQGRSDSIILENTTALLKFLKYYNFLDKVDLYLNKNQSVKWTNFLKILGN